MPHDNTSRLTRIYYFLTYQCHIPLAPEHYLDLLVLLALSAVCLVLCAGSGGEDPLVLARASRLCAMTLGFHLLTLAWRVRNRNGFKLQNGSLLFVPWLAWGVLDWTFFSPKPWQAETGLIVNCMAFIAFSVSLHHYRSPLLKWMIGGLIAAFVVLMTGLALGIEVHLLDWLKGRVELQPLGGTLKRPVSAGAVLLLVFFPCFGVALGLRWHHWQRLLAVVACAVLIAGILATAHIGVITGLFIGILIASYLLTRKWTTRAALIIPAAFALFTFCGLASNGIGFGFNRLDLVYSEVRATRENTANEMLQKEEAAKPTPPGHKPRQPDIEPVFSFPRTAIQVSLEKPLQGQGTAGFPAAFELNRPVAWEDTPRSPGSLPLALFAEDGFLGSVLFFAPVAWIWFSVLRTCVALPRRERREKKPGGEYETPPVPEDRLFLGSAFAGSTAAGIALLFDYPGPMPAVACLFALLAGAMYRYVRVPNFTVPGGWTKEIALIVATIVVPVAWLAWTRAPLKAASFAEKSLAAVSGTLPVSGTINAEPIRDSELKARLDFAEKNARIALRANPRNGDAWHALALTALRRFKKMPDQGPVLGALARHATAQALELSPHNFEFYLARGHALQMTGDETGARHEFEEALSLAPGNAAAALDYASLLANENTSFAQDKARGILRTSLHHNPLNKALQQRLNLLSLGTANESKTTAPASPTSATIETK